MSTGPMPEKRRRTRAVHSTVGFKTVFWVVAGFTALGVVGALALALLPPERQTDNLRLVTQGLLGLAEAGFGGILGLMVGKGHGA